MNIGKIFRAIGRGLQAGLGLASSPIGQTIMAATVPFAIPLVRASQRAVLMAEDVYEGVKEKSADKALLAAQNIAQQSPEIVKDLNEAFGKPLIDEDRYANAARLMNEAMVELYHAYGVFQKTKKES